MTATAGARSLLDDPALDVAGADLRRLDGLRVAVLTYEFIGVTHNGGIGTAYSGLAQALAEAGAEVEVLATGLDGYWTEEQRAAAPGTARALGGQGLRIQRLDADGSPDVLASSWDVRRAYAAYRWLREQHDRRPFHVVHVPESRGHGAFVLAAKRAGLAFAEATVVVGVHSPMLWQHEGNLVPFDSLDALVADHLERRSLRDADVLVAPSAYMFEYLDERGYETTAPRFVQQNVTPRSGEPSAATAPPEGPTELVFFGRLETRKGLDAFLDAVDLLAARDPRRALRVTFLGRAGVEPEPPEATVRRRSAAWPWPVTIHSHLDQPEALAYVRSRRCVLAMPSRVENSPMTVLEALELGVPFVASGAGGTAELVCPDDRDAVIVPWHAPGRLAPAGFDETYVPPPAAALADALAAAIERPTPARPALCAAANREAYLRWHAALADGPRPAAAPEPAASGSVRISTVRVPSDDAEGSLADAVGEADGTHVLLLARTHDLVPGAHERLAEVVRRTGAGVVTFAVSADRGRRTIVPPGGPVVAGALDDVFGAGSALVRRDLLAGDALAADAPGPAALHAALAALALAGHEPFVVPEPLAVLRAGAADAADVGLDARTARFVLRAYRAVLPADVRALPGLTRALAARLEREAAARCEAVERVVELDDLRKDAEARVAELDAMRQDAEAAVRERDRELEVWRQAELERRREAQARSRRRAVVLARRIAAALRRRARARRD